LEIPVIQDQKFCFLPKKQFYQQNRQISVTVQKSSQECLYINCCGISDPSSPTPSNSSVIKTPENTEEDQNAPQSAAEGDIQMEYSSDWLYNPSIGTLPTNYLQELRSGQVPSDNKFDNLAPVQSHVS
jgi:hypothetical protein